MTTYFREIFKSSNPAPSNIEKVVSGVSARVSPDMNLELLRPFEEDDVKREVFAMGAIKAPGSDGFPAIFYQKNWEVVGERVTSVCLGILNNGDPVTEINDTVITLIPKVNNPEKVSEF